MYENRHRNKQPKVVSMSKHRPVRTTLCVLVLVLTAILGGCVAIPFRRLEPSLKGIGTPCRDASQAAPEQSTGVQAASVQGAHNTQFVFELPPAISTLTSSGSVAGLNRGHLNSNTLSTGSK